MLQHKFLSAVSAVTLLGGIALAAGPALAGDMPMQGMHHQDMHQGMAGMGDKAGDKGVADPVEAQIARLHDRLKITPEQQPLFDAVARAMRDNRDSHKGLMQQKQQNEGGMTALEDLRNYAEIAQHHADSVKTLADAFTPFYAALSDDQKKAADELFRQHKRRIMGHHHMMHHAKQQ